MTDAASIGDNQPPPSAGLIESLPADFAELLARTEQLVEAGGRMPAIDNEDAATKATTFQGQILAALKRCKTGKTEASAPLNADLKTVRAFFSEIEDDLRAAQTYVEGPLTAWAKEKRDQAAEAQRKAQEAAQAGQDPERDAFGLLPLPQDAVIRDGLGDTTSLRETWHYDLEDISKVPPQFLALDRGKIRKAIGAGAREIAGLKIYSTEKAVTRAASSQED
jgi:ElaB/YqjD/DUF883 family membrane-anchored ribosome-binding protein